MQINLLDCVQKLVDLGLQFCCYVQSSPEDVRGLSANML
jgi:hypothetical protein